VNGSSTDVRLKKSRIAGRSKMALVTLAAGSTPRERFPRGMEFHLMIPIVAHELESMASSNRIEPLDDLLAFLVVPNTG